MQRSHQSDEQKRGFLSFRSMPTVISRAGLFSSSMRLIQLCHCDFYSEAALPRGTAAEPYASIVSMNRVAGWCT